ncbi:ATP-binding protein [Vallicoccus soli]|uniref:ATP-binding protein n=1 Tax=Vallicoccus soli TaxID=2339232 RepID=UPI001FE5E212|nr:ATP-binding protein [Vallicoccus soli]
MSRLEDLDAPAAGSVLPPAPPLPAAPPVAPVEAPAPAPVGAVPPVPAARPPLQRASGGRVVAGVCRGVADHLGVDVLWVRLVLVAAALLSGAGILAYAALWVFAPLRVDPEPEEEGGSELGFVAALGAIAVGGLLLVDRVGLGLSPGSVWPVVVAGLGVVVLWRHSDDVQRARLRQATGATRRSGAVRVLAGLVLVLVGLALFLSPRGAASGWQQGLLVLAVVVGLVLVSGPWWLRMVRDLSAERAARIREQERAEIAAHVHDSVLHTLTLIQRSVDDPREVARLARSQERELRTWLYRPVADPETTLTAAVERVAAEVEDAHGVAVEVVVVGDRALDEHLRAMLLATREALVNAAKYAGGAAISVYAEVEPDQVTVFVRDRGPGFDLDAVPEDRLGVRQSVIGRMDRHGGTAVVRTARGEGTEVQLQMPVADDGSAA